MPGHEAIEVAARESYGRLIAFLARRTGDVAAAEDALAEAFLAALRTWPTAGVPERPEAWLLATARRKAIDQQRREQAEVRAGLGLARALDEADMIAHQPDPFPDERLRLLFACAHPAVDDAARTPLLMQAVLGLDAARIASAFLVAPATMSQRLVRAKARLREANVRLAMPEPADLPARLAAVLEAIYAAFGLAWDESAGDLSAEAVWLARLVGRLLPEEPEAAGLLALLLYLHARRDARRDAAGAYVPLDRQDPARWDTALIDEAERELHAASRHGCPGRFQLEAAIQSVHVDRRRTGSTNWPVIAALYEGLFTLAPTTGVLVGRAVARGHAHGPEAALAALDELPAETAKTYQPYWAARAHWLSVAGRLGDARTAYQRAAGLATDPAARQFLLERLRDLEGRA